MPSNEKAFCLNCHKQFKGNFSGFSECPSCHKQTLYSIGKKVRLPKKSKAIKEFKKILENNKYWLDAIFKNATSDALEILNKMFPNWNKNYKKLCAENNVNYELAKKRNLSVYQIEQIGKYRRLIDDIFLIEEGLKCLLKENENRQQILERVKRLAKEFDEKIKDYEKRIQYHFGFKPDDDYLKYIWLQPLCTCPISDNLERLGISQKFINTECIIHGDKAKK